MYILHMAGHKTILDIYYYTGYKPPKQTIKCILESPEKSGNPLKGAFQRNQWIPAFTAEVTRQTKTPHNTFKMQLWNLPT